MDTTTKNTPVVLTEKVKEFKLIARNALRMELINPILAGISQLENEIKKFEECIKNEEKNIAIAEYRIERFNRLDANHPDLENLKKNQGKTIERHQEYIKDFNKEIERHIKIIGEERTAIARIETGETLVSAGRLEEMVNKLILQEAKNTIVATV